MISITNAVESTWIFISIFIVALLLSVRTRGTGKKGKETRSGENVFFPLSISTELKGFAILAIVFSHIGYFLVTDHRFLFPLSVAAGVGVDLFLLMSGFGLTMSMLKKQLSIGAFYKDRLAKLLPSFWIVLAILFVADFFILKQSYPWHYILQSFLGFFPHADLFHDVDSPLWYFTLILFYYLLFPFVFMAKRPWFSAVILFIVSFMLLCFNFSFISGVSGFYELHLAAFPLGMIVAWLFSTKRFDDVILKVKAHSNKCIYFGSMAVVIFIAAYFSYYSGVGQSIWIAESISLLTVAMIITLFLMKKVEFGLFYLFGIFSYEIYLFHWPLLERYDIFFAHSPAWLAVVLYLAVFIALGWVLQKATKKMI